MSSLAGSEVRLAELHDHLVAPLARGHGERWLDVGTGQFAVLAAAAVALLLLRRVVVVTLVAGRPLPS